MSEYTCPINRTELIQLYGQQIIRTIQHVAPTLLNIESSLDEAAEIRGYPTPQLFDQSLAGFHPKVYSHEVDYAITIFPHPRSIGLDIFPDSWPFHMSANFAHLINESRPFLPYARLALNAHLTSPSNVLPLRSAVVDIGYDTVITGADIQGPGDYDYTQRLHQVWVGSRVTIDQPGIVPMIDAYRYKNPALTTIVSYATHPWPSPHDYGSHRPGTSVLRGEEIETNDEDVLPLLAPTLATLLNAAILDQGDPARTYPHNNVPREPDYEWNQPYRSRLSRGALIEVLKRCNQNPSAIMSELTG